MKESIKHNKNIKMYNSFSERKAPIKNGIATFEYDAINYIVPCRNGKIHGKAEIKSQISSFKHEIYFNQDKVDSTFYYYENVETLYVCPLNDTSTLAIRFYENSLDTTIESVDLLWSDSWFWED